MVSIRGVSLNKLRVNFWSSAHLVLFVIIPTTFFFLMVICKSKKQINPIVVKSKSDKK